MIEKSKNILTYKRYIQNYTQRGRITKGQKNALLKNTKYLLDISQPISKQWPEISTMPITIEIGIGNGDNILYMAKNNPNRAYIGIDVYSSGIGKILATSDIYTIHNLRILHCDYQHAFAICLDNINISEVILFFPDPWPKTRHTKRRLLQKKFLLFLEKKIISGGCIWFVTDWHDYAIQVIALFAQSHAWKLEQSIWLHTQNTHFQLAKKSLLPTKKRTTTAFEKKAYDERRCIYEQKWYYCP